MHGYNFSERCRRNLAAAREEAQRLHHEYVGTEHILLGLVRDEDGVVAVVLDSLGLDPDAIRRRIDEIVKRGTSENTVPDLPYTSRSKKVLELAMMEARDLGHSYVGPEHLLVALAREQRGMAAQVLVEFGATEEVLRETVLTVLGAPLAPQDELAPDEVRWMPERRVAGVFVEIELDDGSTVSKQCDSIPEAVDFLFQR